MKTEKRHLPLFGVGPIIIALQVIITVIGIIISYYGYFDFGKIDILNIPFKLIGIALICFGIYLNYGAKHKSKLFEIQRGGVIR